MGSRNPMDIHEVDQIICKLIQRKRCRTARGRSMAARVDRIDVETAGEEIELPGKIGMIFAVPVQKNKRLA